MSWRVIPRGMRHNERHTSVASSPQSRTLAGLTLTTGVFVEFIAKKPFAKLLLERRARTREAVHSRDPSEGAGTAFARATVASTRTLERPHALTRTRK